MSRSASGQRPARPAGGPHRHRGPRRPARRRGPRIRERLQLAADTERERLRRDLHDGLGPSLSGVVLGLGAARTAASRGQLGLLDELLARVAEEVARSVARSVGSSTDSGRPRCSPGTWSPRCVRMWTRWRPTICRSPSFAPDIPLDLPPAVEEAAYRICLEAVTNVVRHADAHCCEVRIAPGSPAHRDHQRRRHSASPSSDEPASACCRCARAPSTPGAAVTLSTGTAGGRVGGTSVRAEFPLREHADA